METSSGARIAACTAVLLPSISFLCLMMSIFRGSWSYDRQIHWNPNNERKSFLQNVYLDPGQQISDRTIRHKARITVVFSRFVTLRAMAATLNIFQKRIIRYVKEFEGISMLLQLLQLHRCRLDGWNHLFRIVYEYIQEFALHSMTFGWAIRSAATCIKCLRLPNLNC